LRRLSRISPIRAVGFVLVSALVVAAVLASGILSWAVVPEAGGSPNADEIKGLYKFVLYVAIVVLVGVEGTLLYSVIRFRKRKGMTAAQIHGNTRLEIAWTAIPALVLVVITVYTFAVLGDIEDPAPTGPNGLVPAAGGAVVASVDQEPPPGGRGLTVQVNGQQYLWRYEYPGRVFSYEEMVVPTDTTVVLKIRAQDVAHSWWIPKLGPKFDAIPGYTNDSWFKISEPGVYSGQCAELCGRGHANMVATVRAVTPDRYRAWIACQKGLIAQAQQATQPAQRGKPAPPSPQACRGAVT